MALVVLLRGVNVGGHRTFRPKALAEELEHLDAVNIGAAGTFVIRRPVTQSRLREEMKRRLPFETEIILCKGQELVHLLSGDHFGGHPVRRDVVRFVSVLSRQPPLTPPTPMSYPESGPWQMKILAREGRYVVGVYRRHMKAIGYLGMLDRLFGAPATTRNWNTMTAIGKALGHGGT